MMRGFPKYYLLIFLTANSFLETTPDFMDGLKYLLYQPRALLNELRKSSSHSRVRRQEVTVAPTPAVPPQYGFVCSADAFRRMDGCCKVPRLYTESVNNICTPQQLVRTLPLWQGIFGALFGPVRVPYRKSLASKNSTIKSKIEDICRVHCIFKQRRWLAPENFIDENLLYLDLAVIVPPGPFNNLLNYARVECSSIQGYGEITAHVNNTFGQKCMLGPFRLLRCIKRSMILAYSTCPGQIESSQRCDLARNELKSCDIFSI
ncbi:uncharacterized protein LOC132197543 [Neocloeon triangulifer]|uniref:uncharacterized protein LOC132197543 n=1 Tax=Neocloeon triangulifer TaxID=2078957 RepID=UPI00286F5634|nr:uncharacterized protein LOC132197543 [Neocloeon triangulifer]